MSLDNKIQLAFWLFFVTLLHTILLPTENIDHHVVCSLKKTPKTKEIRRISNQLIHKATYEIKQQCKKLYNNSIEQNPNYSQRRDSVFFVQFNHKFNRWTLYKPSFIPYDEFVKLIKKIYTQYGLQIHCYRDELIKIAKTDVDFDTKFLTLDDFENYKKMTDEDLLLKIKNLENNNSKKDAVDEIEKLKKILKMKRKFFWHLQIPTTGLLPGDKFDIADTYKPIAWHFLLWDLAPKKGAGAKVAIIDTGASAFNLQEKEFSSMYKKNINITIPNALQDYGYNLVSENGLDPIGQIAINFGNYCDHLKFDSDELMQKLPELIIEFIKNKKNTQMESYFIKNVKKDYLDNDRASLNEKGLIALKDLLYGKHGISPSGKDSFFHIVTARAPYNQEVLLETLPAPKVIGDEDSFAAGHGTFTQGVVNAKIYNNLGISGLAPEAEVIMIKAFKDSGTTNKTTLNAALQRAITLKNSIISMSLKITDDIDKVVDAPLKELIDSIDYVVAASGNDGTKLKKEAYPAKFESVAFDVGAFQYDEGQYNICPFTQKELAIGPKFVAPGLDIFSAGLTPDQTSDSMYVFMTGTSIAVPIITGFLALVAAEFQDVFTREQILKVIYKFSMKLNKNNDWQEYIKLGTPDMRSSLLCLHVLQSLQNFLKNNSELKYSFQDNFDNLVQAIHTINYYIPSYYENITGSSFINDFSGYNSIAQAKSSEFKNLLFYSPSKNVSECVNFFTNLIATTIDSKKNINKKTSEAKIPKKLFESLQNALFAKKFNLFAKLSLSSQNRINGALAPRNSCIVPEV